MWTPGSVDDHTSSYWLNCQGWKKWNYCAHLCGLSLKWSYMQADASSACECAPVCVCGCVKCVTSIQHESDCHQHYEKVIVGPEKYVLSLNSVFISKGEIPLDKSPGGLNTTFAFDVFFHKSSVRNRFLLLLLFLLRWIEKWFEINMILWYHECIVLMVKDFNTRPVCSSVVQTFTQNKLVKMIRITMHPPTNHEYMIK